MTLHLGVERSPFVSAPTPRSSPPPAPPPPALARRFRFGPCLGRGESGTVYRATTRTRLHDLPVGTEVAVKILLPELLENAEARKRFRREGAIGRRVDSPHVVRIHGVEEVATDDGPIVYLVSELVEGRTLRALLIERGAAVGDLVRRIGEQSARGLAALHAAGIVHRDVKPENILITSDDAEVKVMDLGLAGRSRPDDPDGPASGGFHGSLAYAAPEVLRGRPATPASDLYALGIVLSELLTGHHPFGDQTTPDAMLHAHLNTPAPRPSHLDPRVPPFLDELVADLLQKSPDDRSLDATGLAETLAAGTASTWWREHVREAPVLASRRRLGALRRSPHAAFVDRDDARRTLGRAMREAIRGHGATIEVTGPPGSGRRRLLDECIGRWLEEHEGLTFLGGLAEREPTSPLAAPFPQIVLDAFLPGEGPAAPRQSERLEERLRTECGWDTADARRLAEICADAPAARGLPPAARADLLHRALAHLIGARRATVLRIDRAEELGRSARLVIDRLAAGIGELPLLLLLVAPRAHWPETSRTIELGPLSATAFVELGRRLFRGRRGPRQILERAHPVLSGLPGALTESLEDLVMQGRLAGRPGDFHGLSPSVRELAPARPALARLAARIATLPRTERHVLQAAAVLGRRFRIPDVEALTGRPEIEVLEGLGAFQDRVVATEGGVGRFRHRGYRRSIVDATDPGVLRQLHRTAAWVLEDRGAPPLEVGLHLSHALEHEACIDPLLDGLEALVDAHSRQQALRVVERLRLHLATVPPSPANAARRLRWHLLAGATWALVEAEDKAVAALRAANVLAGELGLPVDKAKALVGLADIAQHRGRFLSAVQLLEQAEQGLTGIDGDEARATAARVRLVHGRVLAYRGRVLDALRLVRAGLELAPDGEPGLRAHLWVDLARWQQLRLRFSRALDSLERAAAEVERTDDVVAEVRVHLHRGRTLGVLGDLEGADAELSMAHALASRYGNDRLRGRARLFRAELLAWTGEHEAAEPLLHEAAEALERTGDRVGAALARLLLRLGAQEPTDGGAIEVHQVPLVDITALLVGAVERRRSADEEGAQELLADALELDRTARVHLLPRLALLRAAGRRTNAERLIERIAMRLPAGAMRRRFVAFADRVRV